MSSARRARPTLSLPALLAAAAAATALPRAAALRPSAGCAAPAPPPIAPSTLRWRSEVVADPNLGATNRTSVLYLPASYARALQERSPVPLLLSFHGQWGDAMQDARNGQWPQQSELHGFVVAFPQGLDDCVGADCGTGWNVNNNITMASTCNASSFDQTCCYSSCRAIGQCGGDGAAAACSWSTCARDDVFVAALLVSLGAELCVDLDAVFATGGSNGGMLTHWLYARLPNTFAALVPVFGLPLRGFAEVPAALRGVSIMSLHDRSDEIIPEAGGYADGWFYDSSDEVYGLWASLKGCAAAPTPIDVPFPSVPNRNLACREYLGCAAGGRVMRCLYDGHHGDAFRDVAAMTFWFVNQTRRAPALGENGF